MPEKNWNGRKGRSRCHRRCLKQYRRMVKFELGSYRGHSHHSLKEPLLLVHFKSFRYSDGEQPFCL